MIGSRLPSGWRWATIEEVQAPGGRAVVSGPFGSNISSRFFVPDGVPVIRGNNLTADMTRFIDEGFVFVTEEKAAELSGCIAVPGDLVFTAAGSLGQVGLIPRQSRYPRYVISNKQMRVRLDPSKVGELFAFYWLASPEMVRYTQQRNTGSSVPLINLSILRSLPIPLPPLPEQRAIAHVLGSLDDKIALNRRMNETLEAIARAIFKSWFVDFDPVRAKAEGRPPAGMDAATAALFPDSFRESALGKAPAGWTAGSVDRVAAAARETVDPGVRPDEVFDHYSIPAYDDSRRAVAEVGANIGSSKLAVPPDAVLLSRLNPRFPRVWLPAVSAGPRAICSTEFFVAVPREGYSREYLYGLFTSGAFGARLSTLVTGTSGSHQRVRPGDVLAMPVVTPGPQVIGRFTQLVRPLHELIATHRAEGATLAAIRGELLPKLISGRLRVRDVHGTEEGKHETKESQQPEAVGLPDQGGVHKLRPGCQTRP